MTSCADIIREYFPKSLKNSLSELCRGAEELRIRINRPVQAVYANCDAMTDTEVNADDIAYLLEHFTQHSVYTYEDEMRQGYITLSCGIRVGICGRVLTDGGKIVRFRNVTGFCIRIPKQVAGCARGVCRETNGLCASILIAAPPGAGKTTLLRDMARELSDTYRKKVCIVDERSEISAGDFYVGMRTDVLDACPKAEGMSIAVRTLSPDVIITDEIGGEGDVKEVLSAIHSGVSCAVSMHGESEEDIEVKCPELLSAVRYTASIKRLSYGRFLHLYDRKENVRKTLSLTE